MRAASSQCHAVFYCGCSYQKFQHFWRRCEFGWCSALIFSDFLAGSPTFSGPGSLQTHFLTVKGANPTFSNAVLQVAGITNSAAMTWTNVNIVRNPDVCSSDSCSLPLCFACRFSATLVRSVCRLRNAYRLALAQSICRLDRAFSSLREDFSACLFSILARPNLICRRFTGFINKRCRFNRARSCCPSLNRKLPPGIRKQFSFPRSEPVARALKRLTYLVCATSLCSATVNLYQGGFFGALKDATLNNSQLLMMDNSVSSTSIFAQRECSASAENLKSAVCLQIFQLEAGRTVISSSIQLTWKHLQRLKRTAAPNFAWLAQALLFLHSQSSFSIASCSGRPTPQRQQQ